MVVSLEDPASFGQQRLTGGRESGAPAVPFDQRGADNRLESADVLADRRLSQIEAAGSAVKATLIGDCDQAAQWRYVQDSGHRCRDLTISIPDRSRRWSRVATKPSMWPVRKLNRSTRKRYHLGREQA